MVTIMRDMEINESLTTLSQMELGVICKDITCGCDDKASAVNVDYDSSARGNHYNSRLSFIMQGYRVHVSYGTVKGLELSHKAREPFPITDTLYLTPQSSFELATELKNLIVRYNLSIGSLNKKQGWY